MAAFLEKAGLARQKFPERVELVDDLPRTASGKVQKNVLRERIAEKLATRVKRRSVNNPSELLNLLPPHAAHPQNGGADSAKW